MKKMRFIQIGFSMLVLLWAPLWSYAQGEEKVPQLSVRGDAELQVPADQFQIAVGVVSNARDADEVVRINSKAMADVERALQRAGLGRSEYQTGSYQVKPRWSHRPKLADENWQAEIVGYTATNVFQIKSARLTLAGEVIGRAAEAGANDIGALHFDLADPRKHREEAIRQATENALADARVLAEAASVRLVRVLSLRLEDAAARPRIMQAEGFGMLAARAEPNVQTVISPADVTVRAAVTLIYELARD